MLTIIFVTMVRLFIPPNNMPLLCMNIMCIPHVLPMLPMLPMIVESIPFSCGLVSCSHTEHHHEKQDSILDIYNNVEFTMTFVLTHLIPILIHPKFYLPKFYCPGFSHVIHFISIDKVQ